MPEDTELPETDPEADDPPEPTADGTDLAIDPWGSATIADYNALFTEFGIEPFDELLSHITAPHYLMRRGIVFGHRDYRMILDALANGDAFAVLSGFMPTGDPHIGHKLVFDELIWHQGIGADAYALIADLEAHSARGLSWEEIDRHARDYLLSLLACGFDSEAGELYRQSTNRDVQDLAFELGGSANFSEMQAIYGFTGETDVSHMQSVITQAADILYPQLDEPKPTVIPVGPDQDPHIRLTRDLAARNRYFAVTEAYASFELDADERSIVAEVYEQLSSLAGPEDTIRCVDAAVLLVHGESAVDFSAESRGLIEGIDHALEGGPVVAAVIEKLSNGGKEPIEPRVRFIDLNAPPEAFDDLRATIDGEIRVYESHIDAFELTREEAAEVARSVEVRNGGYGFQLPSSVYHRFMTGLTGGKMSSSVEESHISLLDDPDVGYDKVRAAKTGGRETAELQRELGGRADECPVYELYAYLLAADDDEYATRVYEECVVGDRLCGDCKSEAAELMREFLRDHQEKRAEMEPVLDALDIPLSSPRKRHSPSD